MRYPAEDAKSATVREIINQHVGSHVEVIVTDESAIYPWALDKMQKNLHKTINHTREYAHGDVHTNTVESAFSLLKRGIVGTWHKVSAKHLPAYLDEMCFRFKIAKTLFSSVIRYSNSLLRRTSNTSTLLLKCELLKGLFLPRSIGTELYFGRTCSNSEKFTHKNRSRFDRGISAMKPRCSCELTVV